MLRLPGILLALLMIIPSAVSQSIPKELLSTPTHLALDKPTTQVKVGSTVTYRITLKNAADQAVAAASNLQLEIQTPSGQKVVELPAGQSSASFTWEAATSGIIRMTVRSGKLHPATGLVLVAPSPIVKSAVPPNLPPHAGATVAIATRPPTGHNIGIGAEIGAHPAAGTIAAAREEPTRRPASVPPPPPPTPAAQQARKLQLYVEPLPIYGNAVDHIWKAKITVAALGDQDALAPVSTDVPVHFNASSGNLSLPNIVLPAGQFSNFEDPVVLTTDRSGKGNVAAISSLGPAGPVEVDYLQPPPTQLRLSVGSPVLKSTGSSTASVQVCILDDSGAITSLSQDIEVMLTAPGQLASSALTIHHDSSCSNLVDWTSGAGLASIRAEASGLKADAKRASSVLRLALEIRSGK